MDIKHKLYPHPVLWSENDDYKTSKFNCILTQERGVKEFIFNVKFELDNDKLLNLIEDNMVEYVLHVECSLSSYREVFSSKSNEFKLKLEDKLLLDKVSICPFILSKNDISNYTNDDFDDDYKDISFSFEKGTILAIAVQQIFTVEKDKNDLSTIPSIFTIFDKKNHEDMPVEINLANDKIMIGLNSNDYALYYNHSNSSTNTINSFIIFPTLIYALERLRESLDELEDFKWVQALKSSLNKNNYKLYDLLQNMPSIELAQIIMMRPISSALAEIENFSLLSEGE